MTTPSHYIAILERMAAMDVGTTEVRDQLQYALALALIHARADRPELVEPHAEFAAKASVWLRGAYDGTL